MAKARTARKSSTTEVTTPYADTDETAWTLRLRRSLVARLDAEVRERNARGEGRWSRNGLVVWLLERGLRDGTESTGGEQPGKKP